MAQRDVLSNALPTRGAASERHAPLVGKGEETAEIQTKQYLRPINFIPKFSNYSCILRGVAIYRFLV